MKIGELVKLKIPGLHGPRTVTGTIKRTLPNEMIEIKTQDDGYWIINEDGKNSDGDVICNKIKQKGERR